MCRNIKTLYNFEPPATDAEIHAASLQFVRKVSGSTKPSKANEIAFERAIEDVAATVKVVEAVSTLSAVAPGVIFVQFKARGARLTGCQ